MVAGAPITPVISSASRLPRSARNSRSSGIGFTATGTVLQVRTVCGSPGCACHADPDKRHGPYWQHTRKIRNKTVTRRLTPAQAVLYQEWISSERALRDLLAQMQQLSDQARELLFAGTPGHQSPAANPRDNRNQKRGT